MIYIAADKHGLRAIKFVEEYLKSRNIPYDNLGIKTETEDMRLEDMIPKVVAKIRENRENKGILSCGAGVGVEIGANKFSGIRACLATNTKVAEWSRVYDNCNVLCLVGWEPEKNTIHSILDAWFGAEYDGDADRLKMMEVFDSWH